MARSNAQANMPLGDHLEDLRRRLVVAIIGLVPIVVVALYFGSDILGFILQPVRPRSPPADNPRSSTPTAHWKPSATTSKSA